METFRTCFSTVEDPRAGNARHDLLELMFVALAAVLCGAEDCTDMAAFARAKLGFLRQVVKLEHGPPSHDTFSRVFRLLTPEPFEAAFAKFTATFAGALKGVVAIDGKALRGAYERGRKTSPLHLVNVWAADALHCRADTAQAILDTGADYALALKANQPTLLAQVQSLIAAADPAAEAIQRPARRHDRVEARAALVVAAHGLDFPGLTAVARVETHCKRAGEPEPTIVRYFLLSALLPAGRVLEIAQTHWTIENQLHWVLDVALGEDASRSRMDNAPQNLAIIRKIALNTLRMHPDKGSIKTKIKRAAWDDAFLTSLLGHMR